MIVGYELPEGRKNAEKGGDGLWPKEAGGSWYAAYLAWSSLLPSFRPRISTRVRQSHYFGVPCRGARDEKSLQDAVDWSLSLNGPSVTETFIDVEPYSLTVFD